MVASRQLPAWHSVLAVVAHPDDESFGLGAVLSKFAQRGEVFLLCLTRGEASTLHGVDGDLAAVREGELRASARALGLREVALLAHPDGHLAEQPAEALEDAVVDLAERTAADGLVVFDPSGVTGHPDHRVATTAATGAAARLGLPVLGWTIPDAVATALNMEFSATFTGHLDSQIDIELPVDRFRQRAAVTCHPSQALLSSVLWRRLEMLGDVEHLRWIHHAAR